MNVYFELFYVTFLCVGLWETLIFYSLEISYELLYSENIAPLSIIVINFALLYIS